MKYKLIILFFNLFMLLSFLAVFLLPVSVLGWGYIGEFWGENWVLPLIFFLLIASLNLFFSINWSVLKHVEKGDWASLVPVLEKRIYERNFITYTGVRLLVHSYLLLNREENLEKLENHIKEKRRKLYNRTFLMFCSGHLLSDKPEKLEAYLEKAWNDKSLKGRDWITINYAFALLVRNRFPEAFDVLKTLEGKKNTDVFELTRLYMTFLCSPADRKEKIISERNDFRGKTPLAKFETALEREKGEMHILFFSKVIEQAKEWAYSFSDKP